MTKSIQSIQDIITKEQNKRHKNHVKAGKKIKEKWIKQSRIDALNEVLEFINKKDSGLIATIDLIKFIEGKMK